MLLHQNKENYVWRQHTLSIEKHTNAHDTSSDPLTIIVAHQAVALLNAIRSCHSLNAYSSGTQAKMFSSVDRRHCIHRIAMPTMLKESEDLPLRDTKRFASYQRLVCKTESKRRHSTHINHPRLLYWKNNERPPRLTVHQCWRAIMLTESEDFPLRDTKRFAFQQWLVCKSYFKRRHSTHRISSMPTPLAKTRNVPIDWSKCTGTDSYCIKHKKNFLWWQHTRTTEQYTNYHDTPADTLHPCSQWLISLRVWKILASNGAGGRGEALK